MALSIVDSKKYLDSDGLSALISKIKAADTAVKTELTGEINGVKSNADNIQGQVDDIKGALGVGSGSGSIPTVSDKIDNALADLVKADSFKVSYSNKTITISLNGQSRTIDASDFVKDSFVKSGKLEGNNLVLTIYTVDHPGSLGSESEIRIPIDALLTDLKSKVTALENTVGGEDSGFVKKVNDVEAAYKAADTALGNRIATLENGKDDYKGADTALETKITKAYEQYADDQAMTAYNSINSIPVATVNSMFG